eukprot:TRINITY_DN325_c0_g2_i4.p1 TRINITY_DN325_c0_g2~~TRINITY_DN325_c0_g2_i4.p1  ORF type:complete len:541 (+),score=199.15 TRINITY_DN325_c0_g2_i4:53-1675(+)
MSGYTYGQPSYAQNQGYPQHAQHHGQQQQQQQQNRPMGTQVLPDFRGDQYMGEANFDFRKAESMKFPIDRLTESLGTAWYIKARVLEKKDVKQWNNARGSGELLPLTLIDDSGEAIRATFFKEGVKKFHHMLQEGQVYYFGNGRIKPAQKRFSTLPHDYEVSFDESSSVQPIPHADRSAVEIPTVTTANWVSLKAVADVTPGHAIDLRCIIKSVGPCTSIRKKDGSGELQKRSLRVIDNTSPAAYEMTLWDRDAIHFQGTEGETLVSRGTRVGRFLDTVQLTAGQLGVGTDEAADLRNWWDQGGNRQEFETIGAGGAGGSNVTRVGFDQIELQHLGKGKIVEGGRRVSDVIHIRGTIVAVDTKAPYYIACSKPKGMLNPRDNTPMLCNKKLQSDGQVGPGQVFKCPIPDHGTINEPGYRYIAQLRVADHTGRRYMTVFDEAGGKLFGMTATQLAAFSGNNPEAAANCQEFSDVKARLEHSPCTMTLRIKEDEYEGQQRIKIDVLRANVFSNDAKDVNKNLYDEIASLQKDIQRYQQEKMR